MCQLLLVCLCTHVVQGQATVPVTGGTASGTGGSATYTIGQVVFSVITGTNGSVVQGVQQPYEISTVTAIEGTGDITLRYTLYPNPTKGMMRLVIKSFDDGTFRFQVYSLNGAVLQEGSVSDEETEVSLENGKSGIYFLRVIRNNREVKVFKIIKN